MNRSNPSVLLAIFPKALLCLLWYMSTTTAQEENPFVSNGTPSATANRLGFGGSCWKTQKFDELRHKEVYTVGVLAIRGFESAYAEFNSTFNDYLTVSAGARFDPPIRFEMKPLNFLTLFSDTKDGLVDFIYVNPSAYSCIESEYEAYSLVSQVSQRMVDGSTYHLNRFGGVIAARADNDDIQRIEDLKGKIVAAASISGLGSGQMQFREMINRGMSPINDPKQVVFTSNQGKVVAGVLNGDFDVGFIRTDQLERSKDANGEPIDLSQFKIIEPIPDLTIDGEPFPFTSSTPLYPEWNIASLTHVPEEVSRELQSAMLALADHAQVDKALGDCILNFNETYCDALDFPIDIVGEGVARCDTSRQIAHFAATATSDGGFSSWTSTLSYMPLRSMQEATGFIQFDTTTRTWSCARSTDIYDYIVCPVGFVKQSPEFIETGCSDIGLVCQEGYQCLCDPCLEVFDCMDSINFFGRCVEFEILLTSILVPFAFVSFAACVCILSKKSSQLIEQAKKAAENERELNEFIAHEVRNPLAAALSASTFLQAAVQKNDPAVSSKIHPFQEDLQVIDDSLRFINDLLRSMLDTNRATNNQMILSEEPIGILQDVFEPVSSLIYSRDTNFEFVTECSKDLVVHADKLRLQQVVLNLARNSAKFVEEGFVRIKSSVINGNVYIFVEDSGPGIPIEKRDNLFCQYQQTLDTLAQGTGVGLSLCKKLIDLMDGKLSLDESFSSGYKEYPGTRIIIDLNRSARVAPSKEKDESTLHTAATDYSGNIPTDGVDLKSIRDLSILFVDDDRILRKQAIRALSIFQPLWKVREVASGEIALQVCELESFDLIFMDQYMTSVEQSLKGTEAVRALRSMGVNSIICGLSANYLEDTFLDAGADAFQVKPFPCKQSDLNGLLCKLISQLSAKDVSKPESAVCFEVSESVGSLEA